MASVLLPVSKNIWDFDPTTIGGCTLWLDGADSNTTFQDVAGTISATSSTNPVSLWNDKTILRLPACLNSASGSTQTIIGSTPPVISVDSTSGYNTLLFGMTTITITSTVAATGRVNVTSSVTIASGQYLATQFTVGGISLSAPYYVINPTGTPTTSFQLASTPGGSAVTLTDSSSSTVAVLASGSLSLPYGALTLTSVSGTTLNVTTTQSLTLAVGVSVLFSNTTGYSGINTSTTYFITSVNAANPTTQISISANSGGTAITVTGSGTGSATIGRNIFTQGIGDSTFFAVAKGTGPTPMNSTPFSYGSYTGYGVRAILHSSSNATSVANATTANGGNITSGSMNITCASFSSNIMSGWANGTPFTASNNLDLAPGWLNAGTQIASASVGSFVPTYPMVGNVGEILHYNRALSNSERQEIEGYLARKWNIQTLLPITHPYGLRGVRPFSRQFVPPDIDTCIGWFDAADLSTLFQDTAGTIPVTAVSQTIKRWNDKSGQNNFVSTTGTTNLPAWNTSVNGLPVVTSNNAYLTTSTISGWNPWDQTYVFVFRTTANYSSFVRPVSTPHGFIGSTGGPNPSFIEWNQGSVVNGPNTLFSFPGTPSNTFIRDVVLVVYVQRSGNLWSGSINGRLVKSNESNTAVGPMPLTGGFGIAGNAGTPYDLEEVIIYNSALAPSDRQQIEGYLMWKWGVQRTVLPDFTFTPGHPHYKFPPPSTTPSYPTSNSFLKRFSPGDLNPVLWFDATDTNTITTSSNRVTGWTSKGTNTLTLAPPSGFLGPLLTRSGQGSSTARQIMDFSSGGYFQVTGAVVSTSTTLTLTTQIAHGLSAGTQIAFYFSGSTAGFITASNLSGYYVLVTASGTSLTITIPPTINGTMNLVSGYIRSGDIPILRADISGSTTLTLRTYVPHGLVNPNTISLNFLSFSFGDGVVGDLSAQSLNQISVPYTYTVNTTPTTSTLTTTLPAGSRPNGTFGTTRITAANITAATSLTLTVQNSPSLGVGGCVLVTFGSGTLPSGELQTTLNGYYTTQTGTTGTTVIITIPSQTTGVFTPTASFINYRTNQIVDASVLATSTAISLIQPATPTSGHVRFTVASTTNFAVGDLVNITGTTNYNLSNQTIVAVPNATSFVIVSALAGASSTGTATLAGKSMLITTRTTHGIPLNEYFFLQFGSSATLPSTALANTLNGTYRLQSIPSATTFVIVLDTETTTGAVSGLSSALTNTDAILFRTDGFLISPVLGYLLENTALTSALNTTMLTAVMVTHMPTAIFSSPYPARCSVLGTGQQSPFIATATTTGGNGGNDSTSGGRDFALRIANFAGPATRYSPKMGSTGRYSGSLGFGGTNSGFNILTAVFNKTTGTIGDVPPEGFGMACQGWRYDSTFSRGGIMLMASPNPVLSIAVVTATSALVTYNPLFSLDTGGTSVLLAGTTGVAPGGPYAITATGVNTVTITVPSVVAQPSAGGTIVESRVTGTTALSISQLRIGGDTNATNTYGSFPPNAFFYEGGVGDILFFAGTLTRDQRQMVEGFLADKYGIRDQLGGTAGNTTGNTSTNSFTHPFRLQNVFPIGGFSYSVSLAAWYDASDSSTISGSGTSAFAWTDKSGVTTASRVNRGGIGATIGTITAAVVSGSNTVYTVSGGSSSPYYVNNAVIVSGITSISGSGFNGSGIIQSVGTPSGSFTVTVNIASTGTATGFSSSSKIIPDTYPSVSVASVNGLNALSIQDNASAIAFSTMPSSAPVSMFMVTGGLGQITDGVTFSRFNLSISSSTSLAVNANGSGGTTFSVGAGILTQPVLLELTSPGVSSTGIAYVNGSQVGTFTTGTGTFGLFPILARDVLGGGSPVLYCEVVAFTGFLSNIQRQQIEGYLAWKWGLNRSLPTTHPYYRIRP